MRADDPAMLLRESMGLASDGTHKAFPSHLVDAFFNRPRIGDIWRHIDFEFHENTNNILVAVDPSGGGASAFSSPEVFPCVDPLPFASSVAANTFP